MQIRLNIFFVLLSYNQYIELCDKIFFDKI